MEKRLLLVLFFVSLAFASGCAVQDDVELKDDKGSNESVRESEAKTESIIQKVRQILSGRSQTPQLGDLCTGDEECDEYCHSYSFECEEYCRGHPENPTCQEHFAFVIEGKERPSYLDYEGGTPFGVRKEKCNPQFEQFGASPLKIEDIGQIEPLGRMGSDHITPTDHMYLRPPNWGIDTRPRDVIAPGDGHIILIERLNFQSSADQPVAIDDYRVVIEHSCDIYTFFIHISELSEKVQDKIGEIRPGDIRKLRMPVEEAEVIGQIKLLPHLALLKVFQIDFSVVDTSAQQPGFANPKFIYYRVSEPWKTYIVDPFPYFKEPIRSQLLVKNLRRVEPFGGRIDYDIDGRLVGNWFLEGTGADIGGPKEGLDLYWQAHLAVAYDYIDPTQIRFSIGDYVNGVPGHFGVKGNSPNPAGIGIESGLVKYELVSFEHVSKDTGEVWDGFNYLLNLIARNREGEVRGVVLFQLLDARKLKAEVFPNKTAGEVIGFTENAKVYER